MFEFRRLFRPAFAKARDGFAGDDPALLELLDLSLLKSEAAAADVAAGRVSTTDRAAARIRQSAAWREVARRTGDVIALRKAASAAELAAEDPAGAKHLTMARLEQARCALVGAEMFGDEGLNAAADRSLTMAAAGSGIVLAIALGKRARVAALQALDRGESISALAALTGYDAATNLLKARAQAPAAKLALTRARAERAELTARCGEALKTDGLVARAAADLAEVMAMVDPAYHPLTWSRAAIERARVMTSLGRMNSDLRALSEAVETLTRVFDTLLRDHSLLDWAAACAAHGAALWALAEVSGVEDAWAKASGAYDRAWSVVKSQPALKMRAAVGERRGALAVRIASVHADPLELDAVEAAFRCDLAAADPHRDAVGWALCQLNLGRLYLVREEFGRPVRGAKGRAAMALVEAQAIFSEYGLERIAGVAGRALTAG